MIDRRYLKETEELTSSWHQCKPARGCQSLRSPRSRPVQSFSVDPRQDLTFTKMKTTRLEMNVCPRSHLPLCHFGQLAVSPSQLEAACPLLLKDVQYWSRVAELETE